MARIPVYTCTVASIGEALWEPPSTGYTKHDGKLVLTTGEVTDDPLSGEYGA